MHERAATRSELPRPGASSTPWPRSAYCCSPLAIDWTCTVISADGKSPKRAPDPTTRGSRQRCGQRPAPTHAYRLPLNVKTHTKHAGACRYAVGRLALTALTRWWWQMGRFVCQNSNSHLHALGSCPAHPSAASQRILLRVCGLGPVLAECSKALVCHDVLSHLLQYLEGHSAGIRPRLC